MYTDSRSTTLGIEVRQDDFFAGPTTGRGQNSHQSPDQARYVLLTGATGFLGGAVLAQGLPQVPGQTLRWLLAVRAGNLEEARARVLARLRRFVDPAAAQRIVSECEIGCLDLASQKEFAHPLLERVSHVIHLGASTSFRANHGVWEVNHEGTLRLVERLRAVCSLQRFLHVSTAMICGDAPPRAVVEDYFPRPGVKHLIPYTASKAATESALCEQSPGLPLVIARPSIVVGHTRLGCAPSGSIFWAIRAYADLGFVTCDPACGLDVVPVDWTARGLLHLLFKPQLAHRCYHLSAGATSRSSTQAIVDAFAQFYGHPRTLLQQRERGALLQQRERLAALFGRSALRAALIGLKLYLEFLSFDVSFDNSRLLAEGMPAPPPFPSYVQICLENPRGISIGEQAIDD